MTRDAKPFLQECRGPDCGEMIWMVPRVKKDGKWGWGPMDVDPQFPADAPDEWDPKRSHYLTCKNASSFGKKGA